MQLATREDGLVVQGRLLAGDGLFGQSQQFTITSLRTFMSTVSADNGSFVSWGSPAT